MTRLALPFVVGGAILNVFVAPDRLPERLGGLAAIGIAHLIAGRLSRSVRIVPHARLVVLLFNLTIFGGLLYLLSLSPGDVDVLSGTIAAMLVGSTLLYPWGVGPQAVFSAIVTSVYLVWAWPHFGGGMRASNAVLSITIGAAMSVIGAWVLERSRRQAFTDRRRVRALAVQRRHLLDIGRDLRSTLAVDAIAPRLVEHARRLIHADVVALVVRDDEDHVHRMVACTDGTVLQNFLGVPIEEHIAATFRTGFGGVELREFPGTPHDDVITPVMEAFAFRRGCSAIFGPAADPTGWISWLRHDDVPFTAADRLAVLGITDQAHTALAAAALYEDAARASRLKSEFVSTMSHELRTPLNVITGYAQILAETLPPDPETGHAIAAVQRASCELLDLIDATLDLGRLENGQQQRAQVHARRRRVCRRARRRRRVSAARHRHRHRHPGGGPGDRVRDVPPGRQLRQPARRRHGPRALHRPPTARRPRRPHHAREHTGMWQHLHGPAAGQRAAGARAAA